MVSIERHYAYPSTTSESAKPCIILVGNKNDLANKKVVKTETAMVRMACIARKTHSSEQKVADTNDLLCIETSAKNSSNVETAFINLVSDILQKVYVPATD